MTKQAQTLIVVLLVAFVLFYIISSPDQAATIAHGAWHWLVKIADGIEKFLNKLVH